MEIQFSFRFTCLFVFHSANAGASRMPLSALHFLCFSQFNISLINLYITLSCSLICPMHGTDSEVRQMTIL